MSQDYINWFKLGMKNLFHAILAWINLESSNPAKANNIIQINTNYRTGHAGNLCN